MPCASGPGSRATFVQYGRSRSQRRAISPRHARPLRHVLRLPVFMFLAILEPVVSFVVGALALLGVLTALFFKFYGVPHFPFALMLGVSVGFGLMQVGYYALLRLFGR